MVILITGFGSEEVATQAFRGGARDHIRNPIDYRELQARTAALLDLRLAGTERRQNRFVQDAGLVHHGDGRRGRSCVGHSKSSCRVPLRLARSADGTKGGDSDHRVGMSVGKEESGEKGCEAVTEGG